MARPTINFFISESVFSKEKADEYIQKYSKGFHVKVFPMKDSTEEEVKFGFDKGDLKKSIIKGFKKCE